MTDDDLKVWADAHAAAGSTLARAVLRLLAERDALLVEALTRRTARTLNVDVTTIPADYLEFGL